MISNDCIARYSEIEKENRIHRTFRRVQSTILNSLYFICNVKADNICLKANKLRFIRDAKHKLRDKTLKGL